MSRRSTILLSLTLLACGATPSALMPPATSPPAPPIAPEAPKPEAQPPPATSAAQQIAARLEAIDGVVDEALHEGKAPGCVVVIGRHDEILFRRAYGFRSIEPVKTPMEVTTVFDLASLTKPLATATSVL